MAIDVKAVICPQCGSTHIRMVSDSQGVCSVCGTRITVQQQIDIQNVFNEVHIHTGEELQESEQSAENNSRMIKVIIPEYNIDEFLREAWITLAEEAAPPEVFNADFESAELLKHQVLVSRQTAVLSWSASIGYDREETYTEWKTVYDKKLGENVERPVTKTRTVTDWRPGSGHFMSPSEAIVSNTPSEQFNEYLFGSLYPSISKESISVVDEKRIGGVKINDSTVSIMNKKHVDNHLTNLRLSLPGDHNRDLNAHIESIEESSYEIWIVPEYRAKLLYGNDYYIKRAFPFVNRQIRGDQIRNKDVNDVLEKANKRKAEEYEKEVWDKTKILSFVTTGLMSLSLLFTIWRCFFDSSVFFALPDVVKNSILSVLYLIVPGVFVFNIICTFKTAKRAENRMNDELKNEKSYFIDNYKRNMLLAVLNNKLTSLGYKPVEHL